MTVSEPDACWNYKGALDRYGYGGFRFTKAHRMAYELANHVRLLASDVVRHSCDNPACCNPKHLSVGTHADNVADRVSRRRSATGERHGRAKLTREAVALIRASSESTGILARLYGVDPKAIRMARSGATWRD